MLRSIGAHLLHHFVVDAEDQKRRRPLPDEDAGVAIADQLELRRGCFIAVKRLAARPAATGANVANGSAPWERFTNGRPTTISSTKGDDEDVRFYLRLVARNADR
jgi:hypothetical protein